MAHDNRNLCHQHGGQQRSRRSGCSGARASTPGEYSRVRLPPRCPTPMHDCVYDSQSKRDLDVVATSATVAIRGTEVCAAALLAGCCLPHSQTRAPPPSAFATPRATRNSKGGFAGVPKHMSAVSVVTRHPSRVMGLRQKHRTQSWTSTRGPAAQPETHGRGAGGDAGAGARPAQSVMARRSVGRKLSMLVNFEQANSRGACSMLLLRQCHQVLQCRRLAHAPLCLGLRRRYRNSCHTQLCPSHGGSRAKWRPEGVG